MNPIDFETIQTHSNTQEHTADYFQSQAKFAYYRGEYRKALGLFSEASRLYLGDLEHSQYLECCNFVLRVLAEREDFTQIKETENHVLQIMQTQNVDLKIKVRSHYVLGICNCYQPQGYEAAMGHFRQAIELALEANDKAALAPPLYGIANVFYAKGEYDEALRELGSLEVLLGCLELHELKSASHLLRGLIKRNQNNLQEALTHTWAAYESLRLNPHFVLYLQTLVALGSIYLKKEDEKSAMLYLELAKRSVHADELPRLSRLVDDTVSSCRQPPTTHTYDLIFDTKTGVLLGKRGELRFEGQFVLRDLLRLFLEEPGRIFTKEDLVQRVWNEKYDPSNHDNKIYVTIKRLRHLLEGPSDNTQFILRAKNGYFFNSKTKILIV